MNSFVLILVSVDYKVKAGRGIDVCNEIIRVPMEVDVLDMSLEEVQNAGYVPVSLSEISSYGIVGNELFQLVEAINSPGGEGIYRVTFPQGARGMLSKFKNENAFFGAISADGSFSGQARLTQLALNPEQIFMAIALMDVSIKMREILEVQKTMLEFLRAKEESQIYGDYHMLNEAIANYKYNWDQEKYINQNLVLVQKIKNDMYNFIELSKKQVNDILAISDGLHLLESAGDKVKELVRLFRGYHDAHYLLSYATFFETLLLKNFREENLDNIRSILLKHKKEYQKLYCRSVDWAEKYVLSSINYRVAPVLYTLDRIYDIGLRKIPIGVNKWYAEESESYRPVDEQIAPIKCYRDTGTSVFIDELNKINIINNKEVELYIDKENIYMLNDTIQ